MKRKTDTMIMLTVAVICFGFTFFVSNGNIRNTTALYNIVFLGILVALYTVAINVGFKRVHRLTDHFLICIDTINQSRDDRSLSITDRVKLLYGFEPIDNKLVSFLSDLKNSQSGICDIDDYINEDEIGTIIRKWFLDLVPDVMTSLGILGTFVGLVWCMKSFDTSNFEIMTNSVSSLVEGIKVAFLTSIYGLVMSIAFSYSINKSYAKLMDTMQEFLDRFHADVIPPAERDAQDKMVHTQKGQYEALKAISMEFTNQMSSGLTTSIAPTLQRIDQALDGALRDISENQSMFLQEVGENYRKMGNNSDANERIVQMMQEVFNRNEDMMESQREFFKELLVQQNSIIEELKGSKKGITSDTDLENSES